MYGKEPNIVFAKPNGRYLLETESTAPILAAVTGYRPKTSTRSKRAVHVRSAGESLVLSAEVTGTETAIAHKIPLYKQRLTSQRTKAGRDATAATHWLSITKDVAT